jgi:hypothetical protein
LIAAQAVYFVHFLEQLLLERADAEGEVLISTWRSQPPTD